MMVTAAAAGSLFSVTAVLSVLSVYVQVHEGGFDFEPLRVLNPKSGSVELFSGHNIIYKETSPSFVCTIAEKRIYWASTRFGRIAMRFRNNI